MPSPSTFVRLQHFSRSSLIVATTLGLLTACGGDQQPAKAGAANQALSPVAALGQEIFNDKSLSASGQMSCASCHDAAAGHAASNNLPAQMGGALLNQQGTRQSPSIRYLNYNSAFFFDAEGTPTGGFFWDGRAASLQEQAAQPFLNPAEMAMPSREAVVDQLKLASYAPAFSKIFGSTIFANPAMAFERMTYALQQYQKEDADLHSFTSKYDAVLNGKASLSEAELRGLALFNNPQKGNCQGCHPGGRNADGTPPLFTDFTYDNLGVPRNTALLANTDASHFDLGLCARSSNDLLARADLCGAFKVPSLRNVALRHSFFHNGVFHDLKTTLQFYVQRDTQPEKWYPTGAAGVKKFDDLPVQYLANVNTTEAPYNRKPGDAPALNDAEIDDVIAFLQTLNDGYSH